MEDLGFEYIGHRETDNSYWFNDGKNEIVFFKDDKKVMINSRDFSLEQIKEVAKYLESLCI